MSMTSTPSPQGNATNVPPAVRYREIMAECQQLMTKVAELEVDRNEHVLVEETLKGMDGNRRAFRLVGDVLVERNVAEVLPSVTKNKENVSSVCSSRAAGTAKEGSWLDGEEAPEIRAIVVSLLDVVRPTTNAFGSLS
jgi:chaperonin cofactor prefoldin